MVLSEYFEKGITYQEYMAAFEHAVASKRTSGPIQTEELAHYTQLNLTRMKRIYKHTSLLPAFIGAVSLVQQRINIICLTEFWCGDAAQNLPVIELAAEQNKNITIRYLFRDENEDLMGQYLTNGGKSIPKYILLDGGGNEIANWGPRPAKVQQEMENLKSMKATKEEMIETIQKWYNADKTFSLQQEWMVLFSK
jgi:hypothetical protein